MPGYRRVATVSVQVRRLADVLDENLPKMQPTHLLNIDAEGFDLKVLRSNDWTRYRPKCALVEALEMSLEYLQNSDVHRFMPSANYELFAKGAKTLIYVDSNGGDR